MADIVLNGDTSGSITIAAPSVAGTNTLTLPANTGTLMTSTYTGGDVDIDSSTLHVDATNNRVGIGTSSPASLLHVKTSLAQTTSTFESASSVQALVSIRDANTSAGSQVAVGAVADNLILRAGNNEKMRIDSSGNVNIGTSSLASSIQSGVSLRNPMVAYSVFSSGSYTGLIYQIGFINGNGLVGRIQTNGSSTAYVTSSDYRLKENNVNITDGINRVKLLKPYQFNFIADANTTVDGFFAHEVQDVVPEAISGDKDAVDDEGNIAPQGIDQSKLVPLLTAALQEAITKIEDLETRIQALENA